MKQHYQVTHFSIIKQKHASALSHWMRALKYSQSSSAG